MQTVVEWYQLKSFVIDLRCLIPEVDIAAITEVIISRVDEFRRLFLAIIFMFLKSCSATSNSDVCDVSFYRKYKYGAAKPAVITSHLLALTEKFNDSVNVFKDCLSIGVKILNVPLYRK